MSSWTDAQRGHQERAGAHIDGLVVRYRVRVTRAMVAAGLMRGHFGPGGLFCVGHFAPEHAAEAGQLADAGHGVEHQADEG